MFKDHNYTFIMKKIIVNDYFKSCIMWEGDL